MRSISKYSHPGMTPGRAKFHQRRRAARRAAPMQQQDCRAAPWARGYQRAPIVEYDPGHRELPPNVLPGPATDWSMNLLQEDFE